MSSDPYAPRGPLADLPDADDDFDGLDLDKYVAEQEPRKPFPFKFGGKRFEIPPDPDARALAAFARRDLYAALEYLLGAQQWEVLQQLPQVFGIDTLNKLITGYFEYAGVGTPGEQPAS